MTGPQKNLRLHPRKGSTAQAVLLALIPIRTRRGRLCSVGAVARAEQRRVRNRATAAAAAGAAAF